MAWKLLWEMYRICLIWKSKKYFFSHQLPGEIFFQWFRWAMWSIIVDYITAQTLRMLYLSFSLYFPFWNPGLGRKGPIAFPGLRILESCVEIKININFYFCTSLWCLERFYEGLKGLHKTFWGTTKKCENKNLS